MFASISNEYLHKCPVLGCTFTGRKDNVARHFNIYHNHQTDLEYKLNEEAEDTEDTGTYVLSNEQFSDISIED